MTTVSFTDEFYPKSKAVDEAFFDENTNTVYVDLHNNIYAYSGVDKTKWERFKKSGDGNGSVGSFYAGSIKRSHGPATNLGHVKGIKYEKVPVRPQRAAVGAPQALVPATPAPAATRYHSLNVAGNPSAPTGNATTRFVVKFSVGTSRTEKSHEVHASDEATALRLFNDLAAVFTTDTLKIRSVTHYFE